MKFQRQNKTQTVSNTKLSMNFVRIIEVERTWLCVKWDVFLEQKKFKIFEKKSGNVSLCFVTLPAIEIRPHNGHTALRV